MELMNLDHPLLQKLMMETPGTYHHSLVVSNLVETGAKAIGANSLLAKVGALYHDIGKLGHPHYFIENQFDGINPHDKLSPLAELHKLGKEITDMICQHHGTRMPMYFYNKSVKLGENPKEADFRYAGPRPQTKEAAILMMADTLEADLTFKDLNKLIDGFTRMLIALNHQRINYQNIKVGDPNTKGNEPASAKDEEQKDKNPEAKEKKAEVKTDVKTDIKADSKTETKKIQADKINNTNDEKQV